MKCNCGNNKFKTQLIYYMDVIVDEVDKFIEYQDENNFEKSIYLVEEPDGQKFTCTKCGEIS